MGNLVLSPASAGFFGYMVRRVVRLRGFDRSKGKGWGVLGSGFQQLSSANIVTLERHNGVPTLERGNDQTINKGVLC